MKNLDCTLTRQQQADIFPKNYELLGTSQINLFNRKERFSEYFGAVSACCGTKYSRTLIYIRKLFYQSKCEAQKL